jgi:hypothetical protein
MAQAGSSRPLTVEALVHDRFSSCGICGGQSGTGFLRILWLSSVNITPPWGRSSETLSHPIDMNNNTTLGISNGIIPSSFPAKFY